jgi:hypothetical protein
MKRVVCGGRVFRKSIFIYMMNCKRNLESGEIGGNFKKGQRIVTIYNIVKQTLTRITLDKYMVLLL